MKSMKHILVTAVFIVGLGLTAYAGGQDMSDVSTGALNINSATVEELSMLPHINLDTARNIVNFRDSNGPFSTVDELRNVRGINRTLLDDLRTHLKVRGSSDFHPYGAVYRAP